MKNYHFPSKAERKDVVEIAQNLAKYLRNEGINHIIFLDASARPAYVALTEVWRKEFPDTPKPNFYFINPRGFDNDNPGRTVRKFNREYKNLARNKSSKIMLFDVCLHSGGTMNPVLDVLKRGGYKNLVVGLAQQVRGTWWQPYAISPMRPDFVGLNRLPRQRCIPFALEGMVEKTDSIVSRRNANSEERERSILLRKEIKEIVEEHYRIAKLPNRDLMGLLTRAF